MRRTVLLVMTALLLLTIPAGAAGWSERITGGGQAVAGGTEFSITVSAWKDAAGNAAGQIEYSRPTLIFHATVECLCLHGDVAVAAGPVRVQHDPGLAVGSDAWVVVEMLEGGVGSGDRVSVRFISQAEAEAKCATPSGSYPGLIYDGNFNIRIK